MKRIYLHKAKAQIARPNTIRDINKQIVLTYVRDRAPISRAEIARQTELQRSTVSAIVDDLHLDGLIEEIGTGDSTGGRKPTLLKLRTGIPVAIGVDITPRYTTIALADLAGQVLKENTFPTSPDADYMSEQIIKGVEKHVLDNKKHHLEVGISVPGVADQATGRVRYIPYFQWSNWEISRQITTKTSLPVTIDNDANAIALAELWFGDEVNRRDKNFITVLVAEGVGTGIVFDGQVYRGERGAAGEFGHMIVGENAPTLCSCGSRNCWEAHSSEKAIVARYQNQIKNRQPADEDINVEQLINLANNGEKEAVEALKETAKYIGIGISNLIIGFSPQAVVVSGRVVRAWDLIKDEIEFLAERSVRQGLPHTVIRASSLGDFPTLKGSLSLVLARKFASAN
ncbi:MAG TPA: ROK family transcriptional regulator [Pyrinomonadaceae bacterium]|jgi:predicted NBD/HSP70 family sugar kinase|nr:ROK family transcriptional regulator [Pyrinomonadaceae bacterium]